MAGGRGRKREKDGGVIWKSFTPEKNKRENVGCELVRYIEIYIYLFLEKRKKLMGYLQIKRQYRHEIRGRYKKCVTRGGEISFFRSSIAMPSAPPFFFNSSLESRGLAGVRFSFLFRFLAHSYSLFYWRSWGCIESSWRSPVAAWNLVAI